MWRDKASPMSLGRLRRNGFILIEYRKGSIVMKAELYRKLKAAAEIKRAAARLEDLEDLRKLISATKLNSGDIAEIIIAFLLGNFFRAIDDGAHVYMTADLDKEGVDFEIVRFHIHYSIQLKWNKKNNRAYRDYIRVIEVGPDPSFKGKIHLPPEKGAYMFYRLLIESGAYEEDEIYDFDDERPRFKELCNEAWKIIHF